MNVRQVMEKLYEQREQVSARKPTCFANGCRLRATVGDSCSFHQFGEHERTQEITRLLHLNEWLFTLVSELRRTNDWRTLACRVMRQHDDTMLPENSEQRDVYLYRLHNYGHYVVGNRKNKPVFVPRKATLPVTTERNNDGPGEDRI
jgi:hypothetical protein